MKKEVRSGVSAALAAAMLLSAPVLAGTSETVHAKEAVRDSQQVASEVQSVIPNAKGTPDNEELFAQYVEKTFYENVEKPAFYDAVDEISNSALYGVIGESALTGVDRHIYNEVKKMSAYIADGKAADGKEPSDRYTSTEFVVSVEGMGVTVEANKIKGVDFNKIISALLADCPYDLYWYDKTAPSYMSARHMGGDVVQLIISLPVIEAYAGPEADEYGRKCTVDTEKTGAPVKAAENAQKIVAEHRDEKDYEKMESYKDEICALTSYNYDAIEDGVPYGDPWQLIYVFDEDESTSVVCEGYAKAFQYLCDLSEFADPNYGCYTVTGTMDGGTGAGAHMWNVVTLGKGSYLVDVTNSEAYTSGCDGDLFMAWNQNNGSIANGYTIDYEYMADGYWYNGDVIFAYDERTKALYGSEDTSVLNLAVKAYEEGDVEIPGEPEKPEVKKGDIDGSGKVEIGDVRMALRHVCGKVELNETQLEAGDVAKGDGKVDLEDLRKILRFVCGKITEF